MMVFDVGGTHLFACCFYALLFVGFRGCSVVAFGCVISLHAQLSGSVPAPVHCKLTPTLWPRSVLRL